MPHAPRSSSLLPGFGLRCVLLFVVTVIAYLPALRGGLRWDDDGHVTRADLAAWGGLFRIWFEPGATQQYIYPRWTLDASAAGQWLFPPGTVALLGALAWHARRSRATLAAALFFGGTLFPVLGFVNVYPFLFSFVADHFQYLASLGVFAFVGAAATTLSARLAAAPPPGTRR